MYKAVKFTDKSRNKRNGGGARGPAPLEPFSAGMIGKLDNETAK